MKLHIKIILVFSMTSLYHLALESFLFETCKKKKQQHYNKRAIERVRNKSTENLTN